MNSLKVTNKLILLAHNLLILMFILNAYKELS